MKEIIFVLFILYVFFQWPEVLLMAGTIVILWFFLSRRDEKWQKVEEKPAAEEVIKEKDTEFHTKETEYIPKAIYVSPIEPEECEIDFDPYETKSK